MDDADELVRPELPKRYLVVLAVIVVAAGVLVAVMLRRPRGRTDHGVSSVEILADRAFTAIVEGDEDTLVDLMDAESIDLYALDCPHGRQKIEPIVAQDHKNARVAIERVHAHRVSVVSVGQPTLGIAMDVGQRSFFDCVYKAKLIGYEYEVELDVDGARTHGFLGAWKAGDRWYLRISPEIHAR